MQNTFCVPLSTSSKQILILSQPYLWSLSILPYRYVVPKMWWEIHMSILLESDSFSKLQSSINIFTVFKFEINIRHQMWKYAPLLDNCQETGILQSISFLIQWMDCYSEGKNQYRKTGSVSFSNVWNKRNWWERACIWKLLVLI